MLMLKITFSLFSNINQSSSSIFVWVFNNQSEFDWVWYEHHWNFQYMRRLFQYCHTLLVDYALGLLRFMIKKVFQWWIENKSRAATQGNIVFGNFVMVANQILSYQSSLDLALLFFHWKKIKKIPLTFLSLLVVNHFHLYSFHIHWALVFNLIIFMSITWVWSHVQRSVMKQ